MSHLPSPSHWLWDLRQAVSLSKTVSSSERKERITDLGTSGGLNETTSVLRPWGGARRPQSSSLRAPTRAPAPWPRAQNSPKMLADTKQAEPSRLKTRRAKAIFLGPSGDEGVEAAATPGLQAGSLYRAAVGAGTPPEDTQ